MLCMLHINSILKRLSFIMCNVSSNINILNCILFILLKTVVCHRVLYGGVFYYKNQK